MVVTRSIIRTTASLPLLLLLLLVLVLVLVQLLLLLLLLLQLFFSFQSQPVAQLGVGYVAVHCTGASRAQHYLGKFRYEWLQTCDLLIVQEIVQQGTASLASECKIGDSSYASWKNNVQVQQLATISSSMWYGLACFSDRTMYSKDAVCTIGPGGHTEWPITAHCPLCRHCCLHDGSANWSLLRVSTSAGARVLTALTVYTAMVMRWPSQGHVSCHWCGLKVMPDLVRLRP